MREELDTLLCEKYPKLFVNRNKSMTESAMHWGFECGDGWFNLIDKLCGTIQRYIDQNNKDQVTVDQVKEKFGSLRFYTTGANQTITGMIWFAESMSSSICETCGQPGKSRGKGWYYTACDQHTKEEDL